MSGINEIKEKAKLSIDEMFDNQSVGKVEGWTNGNMENQQSNHPPKHLKNKMDIPLHGPISNNEIEKKDLPNTHFSVRKENQVNGEEYRETGRPQFSMKNQQTPKSPSYKMTFNLTEDIYKAFNDLYAKRMLLGKKTEKSDLICEAIQWLIKMEDE